MNVKIWRRLSIELFILDICLLFLYLNVCFNFQALNSLIWLFLLLISHQNLIWLVVMQLKLIYLNTLNIHRTEWSWCIAIVILYIAFDILISIKIRRFLLFNINILKVLLEFSIFFLKLNKFFVLFFNLFFKQLNLVN